jgi:hypothetical protein
MAARWPLARSFIRALAIAVLVLVGALAVPPTGADAKVPTLPTTPTCAKFSTRKISALLGVGRMYLVHSLVNGTSCTFYGVSAARANQLVETQVPPMQIKYVPSLMIDVQSTRKRLFDVQFGLLSSGKLPVEEVRSKVRLGSEEFFSYGVLGSANLNPCEPEILFDNWTGPPSCKGQASLQEIAVLAWIPFGSSTSSGRLVYVSAGVEDPPGRLTISHMLGLASESVSGALY